MDTNQVLLTSTSADPLTSFISFDEKTATNVFSEPADHQGCLRGFRVMACLNSPFASTSSTFSLIGQIAPEHSRLILQFVNGTLRGLVKDKVTMANFPAVSLSLTCNGKNMGK